jgi:hypothetical protein
MDWVLVVSGDDAFQQRSMEELRGRPAVGAVTDAAARRLAGSLRPEVILVDGSDSYGRDFLNAMRLLPERARPKAVVVGAHAPGFRGAATIHEALSMLVTVAA